MANSSFKVDEKLKKLTLVRMFDAPRALVFRAWTDPKLFAEWWGPKYFTNPRCELDVRVGGKIHVDMRAPDGTVFPLGGEFREIVPPERLVFTATARFSENEEPSFENLNTITFEEIDGKTRLTLQVIVTVLRETEMAAAALGGMETGWSMSFDKLNELASKIPIVLERTLNAPIDRVWKALTDIEALHRWYFPTLNGFKAEVGYEFYFEGGPPEKSYTHLGRVTEVIPGKKLSHTWAYKGYEGESLLTFELHAEGAKTRIRLTHSGIETFPTLPEFAKHNFLEGWTSILDTSLKPFVEEQA